jgi:hypothetical protein
MMMVDVLVPHDIIITPHPVIITFRPEAFYSHLHPITPSIRFVPDTVRYEARGGDAYIANSLLASGEWSFDNQLASQKTAITIHRLSDTFCSTSHLLPP